MSSPGWHFYVHSLPGRLSRHSFIEPEEELGVTNSLFIK